MNIDDLIHALKGASVTINIQGGTGNTMYTAPVQHNTYNRRGSGSRRAIKAPGTCNICGEIAGGRDIFYHFVGWSHQQCIDAQDKEDLKKYDRGWRIVKSTPDEFPDIETPLQLPASQPQKAGFDLQAHLAELEARYAESVRQMAENGRRFREEEARYFASISPHASRAAELLTPQEQREVELMCYYADHPTE